MIIVFYDGQCGLCSKEINYYRQLAPDGIFEWQDITKSAEMLNAEGISLSEGLKLLHAKDRNDNVHVGLDAFILIWMQLPKWRLVATFLALPIIRQIVNTAYHFFAFWRFKRSEHCQLALRNEAKS